MVPKGRCTVCCVSWQLAAQDRPPHALLWITLRCVMQWHCLRLVPWSPEHGLRMQSPITICTHHAQPVALPTLLVAALAGQCVPQNDLLAREASRSRRLIMCADMHQELITVCGR